MIRFALGLAGAALILWGVVEVAVALYFRHRPPVGPGPDDDGQDGP